MQLKVVTFCVSQFKTLGTTLNVVEERPYQANIKDMFSTLEVFHLETSGTVFS